MGCGGMQGQPTATGDDFVGWVYANVWVTHRLPHGTDEERIHMCASHEEAALLMRLLAQFERNGEWLKARCALQDLYSFDPSDARMYERLRAMEKNPGFKAELIEDCKKRGKTIQPAVSVEDLRK